MFRGFGDWLLGSGYLVNPRIVTNNHAQTSSLPTLAKIKMLGSVRLILDNRYITSFMAILSW